MKEENLDREISDLDQNTTEIKEEDQDQDYNMMKEENQDAVHQDNEPPGPSGSGPQVCVSVFSGSESRDEANC